MELPLGSLFYIRMSDRFNLRTHTNTHTHCYIVIVTFMFIYPIIIPQMDTFTASMCAGKLKHTHIDALTHTHTLKKNLLSGGVSRSHNKASVRHKYAADPGINYC